MYFKHYIYLVIFTTSTLLFLQHTEDQPVAEPEDNTAAVVKLDDRIVEPKDAPAYSQQFHWLIRKIGQKRKNIILEITSWKRVEILRCTLSSIFLKTVAEENRIRKGNALEEIQVYLHIPLKSFDDRGILHDIQNLAVDLVNLVGTGGKVSGVIFEISWIQTQVVPTDDKGDGCGRDMTSTIVKFKNFLNSVQVTFGHKLKMGLGVNSYKEFMASLVGDFGEIVSSFDMLVLNANFVKDIKEGWGDKEQGLYFGKLVKLLQEKFKRLVFYQVANIYDLQK